MKQLLSVLSILSLVAFGSGGALMAQDSQKQLQEAAIKNLINSQQYSFVAQSVIPMGMPAKELTDPYLLKISKDSIQAALPYYGKTNSIPTGVSDNGIIFKSADFKYIIQEKKKGGWNIKILLKDAGDFKQLNLNITAIGYATLGVTSNYRDFITFNGYVQ